MEEEGAVGWTDSAANSFTAATREARDRLREATARMAREAGLSPSPAFPAVSPGNERDDSGVRRTVAAPAIKTPRYSGKSDWEAFLAQFELLAHAGDWPIETKALQLALCLTDDALSCLLLLSPEERRDYHALVGSLQRRFGQCVQPGLLRNELNNRCRRPGEPLRALANDVESLSRRAYSHMPPGVQSELARDQFIRAIHPADLRVQVQLQHPQSLQAALEMAVERENVGRIVAGDGRGEGLQTVRAAMARPAEEERPAWLTEVTELIRAVSLQQTNRPRPGPRLCWGCGQPGHLARECPTSSRPQGNGSGPV